MGSRIWYLEDASAPRGKVRRTVLRPLPFVVGRRGDSDLRLDSYHGSQRHAQFFSRDGALWLRDLCSTNGTLVNGERITSDCAVGDGDIVHFADREYRLVAEVAEASPQQTAVFSRTELVRLNQIVRKPQAFREMLGANRLHADFQPLVRLPDRSTYGYEILGRGQLDGRMTPPADLFFIAGKLDQEIELSVSLRAKGVELARFLPRDLPLFLNTHPKELEDCETLLDSVRELRRSHPEPKLVLEIHEAAITDLEELGALRAELERLDVALAFDDFGAGQSRLVELRVVAPRFLKFDAAVVRGLNAAPRSYREIIRDLVRRTAQMEITAIAECVETAEEAETCAEIGFELAQGYYFGRPAPVETYL